MCVKNLVGCFLCLVNMAVLLVGLAVLAVGAILQWGKGTATSILSSALQSAIQGTQALGDNSTSTFLEQLNSYMNQYFGYLGSAGLIIFITGCVISIVAGLGFCGACCRLKILLTVYVVCVGVILAGFIILLIVFLAMRPKLEKWGADNLQKALWSEYQGLDKEDGLSRLFDTVQARLDCCGILSYVDFNRATKWNRTYEYNGKVYEALTPVSCCKMIGYGFEPKDKTCPFTLDSTINNYKTPCYPKLWGYVNKYNNYVIYALLATIGVLAALFFLTIWLIKMAAKDDYTPF